MAHERQPLVTDFDDLFTLAEASQCCGVSAERILLLVGEGVLTPKGKHQREWRFATADVYRARCALRLERDPGVNPVGAALAIELIDEMEHLRQRVRLLESLTFDR